ncbi:MAG: hypothetical protein GF398_06340 [Chitinivibrionales bacterium]|nr:hypothetical protein [Chitinivibrionales bacterium]
MKNALIRSCLSVLLFFTVIHGYAQYIDTTLTGNGSPGPYHLGTAYIDSASLSIIVPDSALSAILPATFISEIGALLFSAPLDSGMQVTVRYRIKYRSIKRVFSLHEEQYVHPDDSLQLFADSLPPLSTRMKEENLKLSGYKSIGVSIGNLGQTNFEQAMEVTISGNITPRTVLKGHLSDQGSSLQGTTREVSELDMVYLALQNPKYDVVVGDQYMHWPQGGLLFGDKKIKGISAAYTPEQVLMQGFGAISGGKYTVQTIRGQNGLQGPYKLTGNGEQQFITPVGGTVRISVNGQSVKEGPDEAVEVDYDFGTITFSPRYLIKDDDIIRIEYEYRTFDYQRSVAGTRLGYAAADSQLSLSGALWYESDNKNHPLELSLSSADRDSLARGGDRSTFRSISERVQAVHVDSVSVVENLYRDSAGFWIYTNPVATGITSALYKVTFTNVGDGQGDYVVDSVRYAGDWREIHRHAGSNAGNFSPIAELPLPGRTTLGELGVSVKPNSWFTASVTIAGQERDRNLFSSLDDDDNLGAASRSSFVLGRKQVEKPGLWLSGNHHLITRDFTQNILSAADQRQQWNDTTLSSTHSQRNDWSASIGLAFLPQSLTEFSYGQLWRNDTLITDRIANNTNLSPTEWFEAQYDGAYFRHKVDMSDEQSRRNRLKLNFTHKPFGLYLLGGNEWFWNDTTGKGHALAGGGFSFAPLALEQEITYSQRRFGARRIADAADSGIVFIWKQSMRRKILPGWKLSASSAYHRDSLVQSRQTRTSTLIKVRNDLAPRSTGFTSTLDYSVNSENASLFRQVPKRVVSGLGSYIYDDTLQEFIPFPGGDYDIIEKRVPGDQRVRKTQLSFNWAFFPESERITGLFKDLEWRATSQVEEHITLNDDNSNWSWLPGAFTLADTIRSGDTKIPVDTSVKFASLLYRQQVDWRPEQFAGWHAGLFGKPFEKIVRSFGERGVEWGGEVDKTWNKFLLGLSAEFLRKRHAGRGLGTARYLLTDQAWELEERLNTTPALSFYVKQTGGFARQQSDTPRNAYADAQGWYAIVKPGLSWRPLQRGFAEASYSFSYSDFENSINDLYSRGLTSGFSHLIDIFADFRLGEHFNLHASYRGEIHRKKGEDNYGRGVHVVSVEVKAFL